MQILSIVIVVAVFAALLAVIVADRMQRDPKRRDDGRHADDEDGDRGRGRVGFEDDGGDGDD